MKQVKILCSDSAEQLESNVNKYLSKHSRQDFDITFSTNYDNATGFDSIYAFIVKKN